MVEVVFHVGAHKCATTSIQMGLARLAAARPELAYIPPARLRRRGVGDRPCQELHDLVRLAGRGAAADVPLEGVVDGLCRLVERHADRERVVISDEYILGGMPGLVWSFYPNAHLARAAIEGVARRFPTSVFLQSRETVGFLRSSHQFRVRLGLGLSQLAFLQAYDLGSISWAKLGAVLFDGAAYDWRVLPIEKLRDPAQAAEVQAALDFVAPGWDAASAPIGAANASDGPLMRAVMHVLNRSGRTIDPEKREALSAALGEADPKVAAVEDEAAALDLIAQALDRVSVPLRPRMLKLVRSQFEEERQSGRSLDALLTRHFAPDYDAFIRRYAPPLRELAEA